MPGSLLFFAALSVGAQVVRLPTGPRLHPAGRQVHLSGTLPLGLAVASGGRDVFVTCGGALQGLATVDTKAASERGWLPMQARIREPGSETAYRPTGSAFYGLTLSPDGANCVRGGRRHGPGQRLRASCRWGADAAGCADRCSRKFPRRHRPERAGDAPVCRQQSFGHAGRVRCRPAETAWPGPRRRLPAGRGGPGRRLQGLRRVGTRRPGVRRGPAQTDMPARHRHGGAPGRPAADPGWSPPVRRQRRQRHRLGHRHAHRPGAADGLTAPRRAARPARRDSDRACPVARCADAVCDLGRS